MVSNLPRCQMENKDLFFLQYKQKFSPNHLPLAAVAKQYSIKIRIVKDSICRTAPFLIPVISVSKPSSSIALCCTHVDVLSS